MLMKAEIDHDAMMSEAAEMIEYNKGGVVVNMHSGQPSRLGETTPSDPPPPSPPNTHPHRRRVER